MESTILLESTWTNNKICIGFNAEKLGLIGSENLTTKLKEFLPSYNIMYMVDIDMVGRNGDKPLTAAYHSLNPIEADFLKETLSNLNSKKDFDIIKGILSFDR